MGTTPINLNEKSIVIPEVYRKEVEWLAGREGSHQEISLKDVELARQSLSVSDCKKNIPLFATLCGKTTNESKLNAIRFLMLTPQSLDPKKFPEALNLSRSNPIHKIFALESKYVSSVLIRESYKIISKIRDVVSAEIKKNPSMSAEDKLNLVFAAMQKVGFTESKKKLAFFSDGISEKGYGRRSPWGIIALAIGHELNFPVMLARSKSAPLDKPKIWLHVRDGMREFYMEAPGKSYDASEVIKYIGDVPSDLSPSQLLGWFSMQVGFVRLNRYQDQDGALAHLESAALYFPADPYISFWQGHIHFQKGMKITGKVRTDHLSKALVSLKKAYTNNPSLAAAFFFAGVIHREQKDFNSAITELTEAIKLNPPSLKAKLHFHRGLTSGDLERKFSEDNPKLPVPKEIMESMKSDFETALKIGLDPARAFEANMQLGRIHTYFRNRNISGCIKYFEAARGVAQDKINKAEALFFIGMYKRHMGVLNKDQATFNEGTMEMKKANTAGYDKFIFVSGKSGEKDSIALNSERYVNKGAGIWLGDRFVIITQYPN
jgi:tetratricopeptide (TPR) repeat protein